MKLNWCIGCGGGKNFGDQLGPVLLRHYGIPVEWAKPAECDIVAVGSILSKVPNGWRGTVLGTGFIQAGMRKDLRYARVLAVRGAFTRKACNLPATVPLGDLGMLVVDLPRDDATHVDALAVPHTIDGDLLARHPGIAHARATWDIRHLLSTIAAAELVYTSSLHVLIAADALGVPHVLEPHRLVKGGMFKFNDYASAFGQRIVPGKVRLTPREAMAAKQDELRRIVATLA